MQAEFSLTQEQILTLEKGFENADLIFSCKKTSKRKANTDPYASITIKPKAAASIRESEEKDLFFGLFILGTEKHESRRIDNQLRGRAGRQ